LTDRIGLGVVTRLCHRDLVDEVLAETGKAEQRSRLLPARVVVYYVMALTLFYGDAYEEVMRKLVDGLSTLRLWRRDWTIPTSPAITAARKRLSDKPLRELFRRVAVPMARRGAQGAWYGPWRVMAIDGVILDVPDTAENSDHFGKHRSATGESAFPQVRVVRLGECGTHAVVSAAIGPQYTGERELARELLVDVAPDMLLLNDRGFFSYDFWQEALRTGAALLWRIKSQVDLPVLEVLPDGSYRSELLPRHMKAGLKRGKRRNVPAGAVIPVRVIEYMLPDRKSGEVFRLLTSIADHELAPAAELAALYEQRWEFEITLDELETHQISGSRVLRSKLPDLVKQEIWALLLTHYAIRDFMRQAADDVGIDPDRLSFIRSLRVIRRQVTHQAGFPPSAPRHSDN
jgi:hypothetical protein